MSKFSWTLPKHKSKLLVDLWYMRDMDQREGIKFLVQESLLTAKIFEVWSNFRSECTLGFHPVCVLFTKQVLALLIHSYVCICSNCDNRKQYVMHQNKNTHVKLKPNLRTKNYIFWKYFGVLWSTPDIFENQNVKM